MDRPHESSHRPEIDGLRAVAALLVAGYHVWLGGVSGGVDAFFVVSAYLITTLLLRQVETSGRVDARAFWRRIVRRLVPTSMLVLLVVALVSIAWLPQPLWQNAIEQTVAAALSVNNWQLAFDAGDYLEQKHLATPVQHYWALSIQMQVYALWPLLFVAATWATRTRPAALRPVLAGGLVAIAAASFAYCVTSTRADQAFAYFDTLARLWEFCAGAMLALLPLARVPSALRTLAGLVGLAGLLACGFVLEPRSFPGYASVWPVASTVLLLAAADGRGRGAGRVLGLRPLVWLGGISFGLYLWHWPVLVFYRWYAQHAALSVAEGVGVIAASIGLAALTARLVAERRPRNAPAAYPRPPRPATRIALAATAPVLCVSLAWGGAYAVQLREHAEPVHAGDARFPGALALARAAPTRPAADAEFRPGLLAVKHDLPAAYVDGCYRPDPDWQRTRCVYGDRDASRTLALVGGSHSAHWLPALDALGREHGWRVVLYTKHNCVFGAARSDVPLDRWCEKWNVRTLELLLQDRPEVVFTTATRGSGAEERVPEAFRDRWRRLESAGVQVVAIRDTPWLPVWIPECIDLRGADDPECNPPRDAVLARTNPTDALQGAHANVRFVEMTDQLCNAEVCPPVIGNVLVYRDDSHLTATYARTLAPTLGARLAPVLPPGWIDAPQRAASSR